MADTPTERRAALTERLRNPPPGRVPWDFTCPSQCAFHDMRALFPDDVAEWNHAGLAAFLGIDPASTDAVFGILWRKAEAVYGKPTEEVTAGDVADALEGAAR